MSRPLEYDLIGKKFSKLTVIKFVKYNGWECQCDCGNIVYCNTYKLIKGKYKSCGKCKPKEVITNYAWHSFFKDKHRQNKRFITKEYATQLLINQNFKCALTNLDIRVKRTSKENSNLSNASIDRINSNLLYSVGNVQWVHKDINILKWTFNYDDLLYYSKLIENKLDNSNYKTPIFNIGKSYFYKLKCNAQDGNREFNISIDDLKDIYESQNGCCALTNLPIFFVKHFRLNSKYCTCTVDRIDNNLGYIRNNIRFLHKDIKAIKNRLSDDKLRYWIKLLIDNEFNYRTNIVRIINETKI